MSKSGNIVFTEEARQAKVETIVTEVGLQHYYTSIAVDKAGLTVFVFDYEEQEDKIALRFSFARPGHADKGYGTRVFVEGPLALSTRTGKPLVTVGLTDSGRAFYRSLERKDLVVIDVDPVRSGVLTMVPKD